MLLSLLLPSLIAAAAAAPSNENRPWYGGPHNSNQLVAYTSNGAILGHTASNRSDVVEYLGIPFAQPPVGELRFAAPVEYSGRGFLNASTWGLDCPFTPSAPSRFPNLTPQAQRILDYFGNSAGTPQGEDCLTLNVWVKKSKVSKRRRRHRPVLVLFYGGRFSIGSTNTPFYNGQFLADAEDLVVVTTNYRINIFGFPGVPGQPSNLGLRDQRLAVEWVQKNIEAFGGDADKISIIGQSSGSVSVDYWSYAYAKDPIVKGLISHSGNALSFPLNVDGVVTKNWYNVSATVGCGSSGDTLACMRNVSWEKIKTAAARVPAVGAGNPLRSIPGFYPVADGEIVFSNYTALAESGAFAKLPYLLGNNQNEQGFYTLGAYARGANTTQAQGDAFLLSSFTCPNYYVANVRRKYGVPVWLFRYFGDWDNLRLYPTSGAYHGVDLEMIFGNSAQVSGIDPSEPEQQLTALMQKAWAAFVSDPAEGLNDFDWPEFDPSANSLIRLGYENSPTPDFVFPSEYAAPCSTIALAGAPAAVSLSPSSSASASSSS